MRTRLTEMFGIELPLFAFSHCRDVVVEVSKAGGMGVLGALNFDAEQLERELAWIDAHIDGKPYGVDVVMPNRYEKIAPSQVDPSFLEAQIPAANTEFMTRLCDDAGIPRLPEGEGQRLVREKRAGIMLTPGESMKLLEVALKHPVKLVVNALGTPPKDLVDDLHARGIKVGSLVGKLEHAREQLAAGVDILVAQGSEAGGHTGSISSMVLWPQVIDAAGDAPVLAAGGIGRGRQMAAALAMGAEGVWTGSIWLGTAQSELEPAMKQRLFEAGSEQAIQSRALTGKPARMLRSRFVDAWQQPGAPKTLPMPLQTLSTVESLLRINRANAHEFMTYPVGQIVGDMTHERHVRDVVREIMEDLLEATERLTRVVHGE